MATGLSDLDELLLRCRSKRARTYLAEAIASYKAGASRAAIILTWLAVVFDLASKLDELALGGDANARQHAERLADIVRSGDVRRALEFEQRILEIARDEFELLSPLAYSDLLRLREDRNKCAHPSMLDPEADYTPSGEAVRYHIVSAVDHLLAHGPAQGKAALDRLLGELDGMLFPDDIDELVIHLEHGPLGRPRESLVRNYTLVLLKELLFPPAQHAEAFVDKLRESMARRQRVTRIFLALKAVCHLHRVPTIRVITEKFDELSSRAADAQLPVVVLVGADFPEAWHALSVGQRQRVHRFVRTLPRTLFSRVLSAAQSNPDLTTAVHARMSQMTEDDWEALATVSAPAPDWIESAIARMEAADGWAEANPPRKFLAAQAAWITDEQARRLLAAAAQKPDLASSWGIKDVLYGLGACPDFGPTKLLAFIEEAGLRETYAMEHWWTTFAQAAQAG